MGISQTRAGDWRPMAELYTDDANYGWNYGPDHEFMAVGREEIRDIALGLEMGGLDGWEYPYEEMLIDEKKGQVIGLWRQIATATRADGSHYEVAGIGGSWFGYAGGFQWSFQRDLGEKDLALALELAEGLAIELPLGRLALRDFAAGLGVPHTEL